MNGLVHARRKDALELGKALAKAKQSSEIAEEKMRAAREALEDRQQELALKDAEIAEYKARLLAMK